MPQTVAYYLSKGFDRPMAEYFAAGRKRLTAVQAGNDYTLLLEKGLGALSVDGQNMDDGSTYGSGGNRVEIEGGFGAVQIRFAE